MNDYIYNGLNRDDSDWRASVSFGLFVVGLCVLVLVAMVENILGE